MLKSDCGNLAMIQLYNACLSHNLKPDVCACSFRANDLRCFANVPIFSMEEINIHDYDMLLVVRNIFDYPIHYTDILSYKGIIVADNTTLYDGTDVYGDIVLTAGRNNYQSLQTSGLELPTFSCGCLKAQQKNGKATSKKIVWIESGHFPYGQKGRFEETDLIRRICLTYPDYRVVVKPRYLISDCANAKHSNADHIFHYLSAYAEELPNLELLTEPCSVEEVIADAQVVLHTYSSAYQEAILFEKGVINVMDIHTEETIDLRTNRFNRIKAYIDKAGQSCSRHHVLDFLPTGIQCSAEYRSFILGNTADPLNEVVQALCFIVRNKCAGLFLKPEFHEKISAESFATVGKDTIYKKRVQGAICHAIAEYEYYLDDYCSFIPLKKRAYSRKWKTEIKGVLNSFIKEHFDTYNSYPHNQAFLMQLAYKNNDFSPYKGWPNLLCEEAYHFYCGKYWYEHGKYIEAYNSIKTYLSLQEGKFYAVTLIDKPEYIQEANAIMAALQKNGGLSSMV